MWVVKLGGSLADSPDLTAWLDALTGIRAVAVPGGGPFADAVRQAQGRWRFDERTAHDMAILAMRQYGRMLAGLRPELATASEPARLAELARERAALWLPCPDALNAAGIPPSWDITSDSLAAWLARELGARHLLLVKAFSPAAGDVGIACERLIERGTIDPAFRDFGARGGFDVWLCGARDHMHVPTDLECPQRPFVRVKFASIADA